MFTKSPLFILVSMLAIVATAFMGCDDAMQYADDILNGDTGELPVDTFTGMGYPKLPVLMVHGLGGSHSNWDSIRIGLVEAGYDIDLLFTIDTVPNTSTCDPGHVHMIYEKVEQIVRETGYDQVDVIGHSNGGTDLMNYMRYSNGTRRVRNWVSIGGANNFRCRVSFINPPQQVLPVPQQPLYPTLQDTFPIGWDPLPPPWVPTDLNDDGVLERSYMDVAKANKLRDFRLPGISYGPPVGDPWTPGQTTLYTSIYSVDDEVVANEDSKLEGGRNIAVGSHPPEDDPDYAAGLVEYEPIPNGVGHIQLLSEDTVVLPLIIEALQGNGANDN